ncbi:MAG: hypothetical protein LBT37_05315 [Lactobacillaceae bacterium]|jgi:hypothetical protein|nr:hypothetical protein [Lactobacillaceae bacterium]
MSDKKLQQIIPALESIDEMKLEATNINQIQLDLDQDTDFLVENGELYLLKAK